MSDFEGFTQEFGAIGSGRTGRLVLPEPQIPSDYNLAIRSYDDRTFSWNASQATPIGTDENTGAIPITNELATYYTLEITPDLGWVSNESMFQLASAKGGNAALTRHRHIKVSDIAGELLLDSPADNKLSHTLSLTDFSKIILVDNATYLWRVIPVKDNGMEGYPSKIQRFRAKLAVSSLQWSIDNIVNNGLTMAISGNKAPNIASIEIDGTINNTVFHSSIKWSAEFRVPQSGDAVLVRAIDIKGNASSYKTVNIDLKSATQAIQNVWNTFDEHGAMVDLNRIKGETNINYQSRIKDVYVHRAGPRYKGLVNGITRELDLVEVDRAMTVLPTINGTTGLRYDDVKLQISSEYISVDSSENIKTREHHDLDTWDWSVTLDEFPIEDNMVVEAPIGTQIPSKKNWIVKDKKVVFRHNDLEDTPIYVTYRYLKRFATRGATISEAISFMTGERLDITTGAISGADDAYRLTLTDRVQVEQGRYFTYGGEISTGLPIRWSNVHVRRLDNLEYQETRLNSYKNHFGTSVDKHARLLMSLIHTQWGFLVADKNRWSLETRSQTGPAVLRTTYDPHLGHWQSSSGGRTKRYSAQQAYSMNYTSPFDGSDMIYLGVPSSYMHSGIGYGTDLFVTVTNEDISKLLLGSGETIEIIKTQTTSDGFNLVGVKITDTTITGALPDCGVFIP